MNEAHAALRIVVVDDHRLFTDLLAAAVTAVPGMTCVGVANNARESLDLVKSFNPDVVLMDIEMPGLNGIDATVALTAAHPKLVVVVLTAHRDPIWVSRAAQAGASGFVPKDSSLIELLEVVRRARIGNMLVAPRMFDQSNAELTSREDRIPRLTERELEVLLLLAGGATPSSIAHALGISIYTCRGYIKTIRAKLKAETVLEAVVAAKHAAII